MEVNQEPDFIRESRLYAAIKYMVNTLRSKVNLDTPTIRVSSDDFNRFVDEKEVEIKGKDFITRYNREELEQDKRESQYLDKYKSCGNETYFTSEQVQSRLSSIDMARFGKMLTGDFFNDNTMNAMVCLSGASYLATSSSLAPNERVRAWIRDLRRIGAPSVSGFALLSDAGYDIDEKSIAPTPFIVKAVRDPTKSAELMHEVFIGLAATNRLRKVIPNFAYIFGGFSCSPPVAGPFTAEDPQGKKVATFCNKEDRTVQAMYENITPSKSLGELLKKMDSYTFLQYYLTTLMALHKAEEMCGFTHYDLHTENLLIRECTDVDYLTQKNKTGKATFYVGYPLRRKDGSLHQYYVSSSGGIPTIIDYGRSHVTVNGQHYGMPKSRTFNMFNLRRDTSNPMHDAFKLLAFSLLEAKDSRNDSLLTEIAPLFRYFTDEDDVLKSLMDNYEASNFDLHLPSNIDDLEIYIDFVIDYINALGFGDMVVNEPPIDSFVLTPVSDRFDLSVYKEIGLIEGSNNKLRLALPQPRTVLEFYDVLTKYTNTYKFYEEKKKEAIKTYQDTFTYEMGVIKEQREEGVITEEEYLHSAKQINESFGKKQMDRVVRGYIKDENIVITSYRTVRDNFAIEGSPTRLEMALDIELNRLSHIVYDYCVANMNKNKAVTLANKFKLKENIFPELISNLTITVLPEIKDLYFNKTMLITTKNYIGKFALFIDMFQSLTVSLKALNYILSAYSFIKNKDIVYSGILAQIMDVYRYIYTLTRELPPIYNTYVKEMEKIIFLFTIDKNTTEGSKEFRRIRKMGEEYEWYINTAIVLPFLNIDWASISKMLLNPMEITVV